MKLAKLRVWNRLTMKLALMMVLIALTSAFPATEDMYTEEPSATRSTFAALDDVRLVANGLLQLGKNLKDFVQKTKDQINDILQKLNIFDRSFYQLSVLASEIKEEEEQLRKTTVVLKANNEEIKSLSLEINSKVEDIIKERIQLHKKVGGLEEKLSGLSQGLLSTEQVAEIAALKDVIQVQERSISELLKAVKEQNEHLNFQKVKIKGLENKINSASHQESLAKFRWDANTYNMSDYLSNSSTDGSFSSDFPRDCGEVFRMGDATSGVYAIRPNQSNPFLVFCEFTEEGAFTIIQRRRDGSVDFDRLWQTYEDGFGDFKSEFWLGLKKIFSIGKQGGSLLHIQMEDWKQEKHSMEFQYVLEGPESNYTIHLKAGDLSSDMDIPTGMKFSTKDHNDGNNDPNCARDDTGGWWFSACTDVNLNGKCIHARHRRKGAHGRHNRSQGHLKSSQISFHHPKPT